MKTKKFSGGWRTKLKSFLPSAETIRNNKWVGWIGPALYHPRLWQLNRKGVATGVAIGIFFGFLVPLLQIPFAAIFAVWFRGHLVAAVISTMITNPLTFAPIYLLANEIGQFVFALLEPDTPNIITDAAYQAGDLVVGWLDKFMSVGKNVAVGLLLLAVFGAISAYMLVLGVWRVVVNIEWYRRRRSRIAQK
ncbi:MAG: DUF2062 domain-containing protein [Proteobacteria bacterium]|nr:DUF2062 domain-containing protein [Pseudomonadota bacterium]MDA1011465.1 DUF2062 domain-containing protein [Pseudomonadota bacterium]